MTEQRTILKLPTADLSAQQIARVRELLWAAFADHGDGAMTEDDWQHAVGGVHFLATVQGSVVAHASVIQRELQVAGRPLRTGYVEAVATSPEQQGHGHGTALMNAVNELIASEFEFGALATGSLGFYQRLGWQVWPGQTWVRTANGEERTPDEDGYIMFLDTPATPPLDRSAPISCEWRPGDSW